MKNLTAQKQNKGGRLKPNSNDFISQMPDDVLVMVLSRLPLKDAVATSSLSPRWRFLWCNLGKLDFDDTKTLDKMAKDRKLYVLDERNKYHCKVNSVILSHNGPRVRFFRIGFDLDDTFSSEIDGWLRFALDKKVETLDLRLPEVFHQTRDPTENYDFPLPLSNGNMVHLSKWPSSDVMVVEMLSLKRVFLNCVNMCEPILNVFLKKSPNLEKLTLYGAVLFTRIHVGGQDLKLKSLKLVDCSGIESISLYDFNLVSFTYFGSQIEFHFTDLPKLKKVDIGRVSVGLENNVFPQISRCVPYIQELYLDMHSPEGGLNVNAIPEFPNLKKLMLIIGAKKDDCLLEYTSIAKACPRLETFSVSLIWFSPTKRRRKVRHVAAHPHQHLKLLEIFGYYGRISDLELAVYVIENAVSLRKIVIDPVSHAYYEDLTEEYLVKKQQEARLSANCQLTSILPRGVELAIL